MAKKTQLLVASIVEHARARGLIADESPETGSKNFIVIHNPGARYGARFHVARGKVKTSYVDAAAFKDLQAQGFEAFAEGKRPSGTVTHFLALAGVDEKAAMESLDLALDLLASMAAPAEVPVAVAAEEAPKAE